MQGQGRDPGAEAPLAMPARAGPALRRGPNRKLIAGGVVAALALGAVVGLVSRPDLDIRGDAPAMRPVTPTAARQASDPQLSVEVAPPAAEPPLTSAPPPPPAVFEPAGTGFGPLPPLARPAPVAPRPPRALDPPQAWRPPEPAFAPPAPIAREPQPAQVDADPSFDCRYARSPSEQMVCGSPRLAAADRALAQAYDRAIRAGVPPRYLRGEQDDWLAIRDDAARHSPGAVADVYEQRIAELRAIARDAETGRSPY